MPVSLETTASVLYPSMTDEELLAALKYAHHHGWKVASDTGFYQGTPRTIYVAYLGSKTPVEIRTAVAFHRMQQQAESDGIRIGINSGFRTMEEQEDEYRTYCFARGNLAGRPGYSRHQAGSALDLDVHGQGAYSWLVRHGAAYGFYRTVPGERWHWEFWPDHNPPVWYGKRARTLTS